jgi:S-adenosylmethionine synthetase
MNNEYNNDAMLTREYQRASRATAQARTSMQQIADSIMNTEQAMATEDNYTMPNRTIEQYLELGYTISYAKSLVSRAEAEQEAREREYIRLDARTMVLATIDELNQYLLGSVTLEAATDAARELTHKLNASW